ncbi:phage tail sheath subtilisin-like domain-containing protein [Spongiactinospora sp. TRM90649]|uniref:phage tail sheath family protein n=1 Tax=Spongiactinospora sp. TRM90649 TaxID=3031114 RepID=UPI0023F68A79|nr:phage tail sheath subtilisin-like domain-containing protein [Spongiactinospora sp. TRM90649]MDF5753115.1 phage tail sheath subtilisin-like domain-containing protein [Spongiactinospora sp. TRM90649]
MTVNGWADFERIFGGLWEHSPMSYAVRDFFLNGGAQAIVVRLFRPKGSDRTAAQLGLPLETGKGNYLLTARYPGTWGNRLRARVGYDTRDSGPNSFNLLVRDGGTGVVEEFRNVSVDLDNSRRVDRVLENESSLVEGTSLAGGAKRPKAHDAPDAAKPLWGDNSTNTKVETAGEVPHDGEVLTAAEYTAADKRGIRTLERADLFNLLCLPPYKLDPDGGVTGAVDTSVITAAAAYCEQRRAVLIVDPRWKAKADVLTAAGDFATSAGTRSKNAVLFFPRIRQVNPLRDNQIEPFAPCGAVAGVIARTDAQRGVWKAPAGLEAGLAGISGLEVPLTDAENGELNPLGVNCLRILPAAGPVVWGARTMEGADRLASEWKYLPVRRTALFLEESLYRGLHWVVFEPNDEPLWAQIRLNVGAFLHDLFRQGAFQGVTPREAYFVKCDKETTTQSDVNNGVVNIVVGFAPLKPAEFVVIKVQQLAGQIAV